MWSILAILVVSRLFVDNIYIEFLEIKLYYSLLLNNNKRNIFVWNNPYQKLSQSDTLLLIVCEGDLHWAGLAGRYYIWLNKQITPPHVHVVFSALPKLNKQITPLLVQSCSTSVLLDRQPFVRMKRFRWLMRGWHLCAGPVLTTLVPREISPTTKYWNTTPRLLDSFISLYQNGLFMRSKLEWTENFKILHFLFS